MPRTVSEIVDNIRELEEELAEAVTSAEEQWHFRIERGRVRFEREVAEAHRRVKQSVTRFLLEARPLHVLTAPVIYGMALPLALLDLGLWVYQAICFRAYGVPRVERRKYVVLDRGRLEYLNAIERFNCQYCGYANGLLAYAREIAGRTEQYWCPIKHARKVLDPHRRYARFLDYGDVRDYATRLAEKRADFQV